MSGLRRRRRSDANRQTLRDGFVGLGGSWLDIVPEHGGEPDALLGWRGQNELVEVKSPVASARDRRLRPKQLEWHRAWRGRPPARVETLAEIVALFR
jgi:hypothetical protein